MLYLSRVTPWRAHVKIERTDDEQRLVFGWLYVWKRADGSGVVDHSKEFVEDPTEVEKAAYRFVLESRKGGEMHAKACAKCGTKNEARAEECVGCGAAMGSGYGKRVGVSRLVECCVFTPEKRRAMGIPEGLMPDGVWVGFRVDDDDAWRGVKSGKYKALSMSGRWRRTEVDA